MVIIRPFQRTHQNKVLVSKLFDYSHISTVIIEVRLLIELDVVRPIAAIHPMTNSRSGIGPYECLICASEKRYYRYTRKINFEEHFEKHSIGKKLVVLNRTLKLFQEITIMVTGIFLIFSSV